TFDPTQTHGPFNQLEKLGDVLDRRAGPRTEVVASLADAVGRVGFTPAQPDQAALPAGLAPTPTIRVVPAQDFRWTFDHAKVVDYLRSVGHPDVAVPSKFDGATIVVSIPAAVLL